MNFSKRISIAKNITKANATETIMDLIEGVISNIQVFFPEGHKGLTHCTLHDQEIQIFPTNSDGDYSAANIQFSTKYQITKPWQLKIKTWNTDLSEAHDIIVRVTLDTTKIMNKHELARLKRLQKQAEKQMTSQNKIIKGIKETFNL